MLQKDIVIVGGARTPMAEYAGTPGAGKLKGFSACELGAFAGKAALERSKVHPAWIDHVVMGLANHDAVDALYGARDVCLRIEGIPVETPALTVNRICGSGAQAIVNGAQMILLDEADFVLAGGMESMSQTPYAVRGIRGTPMRFGPGVLLEDVLFQSLNHPLIGMFMAQTAEKLARRYGVTREESDQCAYESQMRAKAAIEKGLFEEEKVPVEITDRKGNVTVVNEDDHCRPDTTLGALAKLRPAFGRDGMVTAGNASGIVDGGAAVVVTTMEKAKEHNLSPLARIVSWGIAGVDPTVMGLGPAPASRKALEKANLTMDDIDLWEVNEAFAPQYVAVEKELGLERSRVNVNGGAIALGHPLGATGCILTLKLIMEMRRRKARYGISTMCIGGGQGIALLVEAV